MSAAVSLQQILEVGTREIAGPRHDEEARLHCGVAYVVWRGETLWFAEDDRGYGVGVDRETVINMAESAIEERDDGE